MLCSEYKPTSGVLFQFNNGLAATYAFAADKLNGR